MTVYLSEHICDSARKKLEAAATIVDKNGKICSRYVPISI